MDVEFPLTNQCKFISDYIVSSTPIFGSMGVGKSPRNPLMLFVSPSIMSSTLGGIDGGLFPWEKMSNMLNR